MRTADDFDEAKRAEAASIATAKVEAEIRRTLELATQASLEANCALLPTQHASEEVQGGQEDEGLAVDEDVIDWKDEQGHEIVIGDL